MSRYLTTPLALALFLTACRPATEMAERAQPAESHTEAIERWETIVQAHFPAEEYVTNEYIPGPGTPLESLPAPEAKSLRLGLPWVLNDEAAPWILARDRGYFAAAGLEVELLPGGPGKDHLRTLAGGKVDLAVINDGSKIVKYRASPTPVDALMVSAVLQQSPGILLTLDKETPQGQRSTRVFTTDDLRGSTIGVPAESEFHVIGVLDRAGIDRNEVTIRRTGNEPNMLAAGAIDFMSSWVSNQPRMLEAAGFKNWNGLFYNEYLFREYADATVVLEGWAREHPATLRRYHWALLKALDDMLNDPVTTSAEVSSALDGVLTPEQVLWRFRQQEALIRPDPETPLLHVDPRVLDHSAAYLAHYGIVDLRDFEIAEP